MSRRPISEPAYVSLLARLSILVTWYAGTALIVATVLGWGRFEQGGGFLAVYLSTIGLGAMWAFTGGLPAWIITLWVGPRLCSATLRFVLVLVASFYLAAPGLTLGFTPDGQDPDMLAAVSVLLGALAFVPLSLLISDMLARVPVWPKRPAQDYE
ncbi:MAG: hypothetical protein WBG08_11815 [Litorimonas sp.]